VMPIGADEDFGSYEARLDALRATPRPLLGRYRCAPVLPRGKDETSELSFALRLEVSACCSAVVLPQAAGESDDAFGTRLEAQRRAPHEFIDAHRPSLETYDAFVARCAAAAPHEPRTSDRRSHDRRSHDRRSHGHDAPATPRGVPRDVQEEERLQAAQRLGRRPSHHKVKRAGTTGCVVKPQRRLSRANTTGGTAATTWTDVALSPRANTGASGRKSRRSGRSRNGSVEGGPSGRSGRSSVRFAEGTRERISQGRSRSRARSSSGHSVFKTLGHSVGRLVALKKRAASMPSATH